MFIAIIGDSEGRGHKFESKDYLEAILALTSAVEDALDNGINPHVAILRTGVGFNPQPIPMKQETVNCDIASLLMIPRSERKLALETLERVTESLNRLR
jgi:hypothetical protein